MKQIQDAIAAGDYKLADSLLQGYLAGPAQYDDTAAILDAAIGNYYGDWTRVWEAARKGLMYNCRNYELYVVLGEYYLQKNPLQACLCYENALFYCKDPKDQAVIQTLLLQVQEGYGANMAKTEIGRAHV